MTTLTILALVFTIASAVCSSLNAVKQHEKDLSKIENNLFERLKDMKR